MVTKIREDYDSPNSRVIVFGNYLGATVAALARKNYPHLIDGAWSSGGLFRAVVPEQSESIEVIITNENKSEIP